MWFLRRAAPPPADPDTLDVAHEGRTYRVDVRRRPQAKRMTLRVSAATGTVTLTLPAAAPMTAARRFVDAHGPWIAQRVARLGRRVAWEPGTAVPLRGLPHRLVHRPEARSLVRVATDAAGERVIEAGGDAAGLSGRIDRWLRREAARDLAAAVARHTTTLGQPAARVTVRDTRSRWGSCSSAGALSFSWRLILAPPLVLDYLAAHEVAHLREMNHSARFWALTRRLCPATDEAEAWLKRHGADLHRYG